MERSYEDDKVDYYSEEWIRSVLEKTGERVWTCAGAAAVAKDIAPFVRRLMGPEPGGSYVGTTDAERRAYDLGRVLEKTGERVWTCAGAAAVAKDLAPFVRRLCIEAHNRGATMGPEPGGSYVGTTDAELASLPPDVRAFIGEQRARRGGLPTRLGELVSGERVLLRRALGIVSELQRLESEVRAVLDAYGSPQVIHSPVEKNPVIPENGTPIKD